MQVSPGHTVAQDSEISIELSREKVVGDIFAKCSMTGGSFSDLRSQRDRYYIQPTLEGPSGPRMRFEGRECVVWSVNDYLGLSNHEVLNSLAAETAAKWGAGGPMGSRMMAGSTQDHIELEAELSRFVGKEEACLFPFGYLGVLGSIQALVGPDDVIVVDKLAHASIIDGARLAATRSRQLRIFRHNDMTGLERLLKRLRQSVTGGILILVEGVYGMTGDCAPIADLETLKTRYGARLFVDDAHGLGVVGPEGRGTAALAGSVDAADVYYSTFAKAFASFGGFSAARRDVVDWIRYNARPHIFSRGLPMVATKTLRATLSVMEQEGEARRRLMWQRSKALAEGLRGLGYYVRNLLPSPLVPVLLPSQSKTEVMRWTRFLRERDVFVSPVGYPVIPRGAMLFRMVPTARHSEEDLAHTLSAFEALRRELDLNQAVTPEIVSAIYGT